MLPENVALRASRFGILLLELSYRRTLGSASSWGEMPVKRETFELVESARGLQVRLAPKAVNPKNVRIAGDKSTFPDRLHRVAVALEAVDRSGAAGLEDADDPSMDAARLRMAVDGVFRWMRSVGIDVEEPHALVAAALGVQVKAKICKPAPPMPGAPRGAGRKPGPLLRLAPGPGENFSMSALRDRSLRMRMVEASMGAAAPGGRGC